MGDEQHNMFIPKSQKYWYFSMKFDSWTLIFLQHFRCENCKMNSVLCELNWWHSDGVSSVDPQSANITPTYSLGTFSKRNMLVCTKMFLKKSTYVVGFVFVGNQWLFLSLQVIFTHIFDFISVVLPYTGCFFCCFCKKVFLLKNFKIWFQFQ